MLAVLAVITALAWAYTIYLGCQMESMDMAMSQMQVWTLVEYLLMFVSVNRRRCEQERPYVPTGIFLAGYLTV